jgi:hypothetical protein
LWKYAGLYAIGIGLIHNTFGFILGWGIIVEIWNDGLIHALSKEQTREFLFWFLSTGFFIIMLGHFFHWYIRTYQRALPRWTGIYSLSYGIVGCTLLPVSGIWLFIPLSLLLLVGNRSKVNHSS